MNWMTNCGWKESDVVPRGWIVLLVCVILAAGPASAFQPPFLSGRVNDEAGIIPPDVRESLEQKLKGLEERTTSQMAVLTVESLEGLSIEDYSIQVAEAWKLGVKGKDNGVLFTVARGDRKMRIEVGYGLESVLTDARCGRILDNLVRPAFRAGDFGRGIEAGVDAVLATLEGSPPAEAEESALMIPGSQPPVDWLGMLIGGVVFLVVIGLFSFLALFLPSGQNWFLYFFLLPFYLIFPSFLIHPWAGPVLGAAWLAGYPMLRFLIHKTRRGKAFLSAHPAFGKMGTSRGSGSGGGFRSGSFSSSSGGFSGGGGSFGGGGSSSSW